MSLVIQSLVLGLICFVLISTGLGDVLTPVKECDEIQCKTGGHLVKGFDKCVFVIPQQNLKDAIETCRGMGGSFPKIQSQEMQDAIIEKLPESHFYGIGLKYSGKNSKESKWTADNSSFDMATDFNNFGPGLQTEKGLMCVMTYSNPRDTWFLRECSKPSESLCVTPTIPALPEKPFLSIEGHSKSEDPAVINLGEVVFVRCLARLGVEGVMRFAIMKDEVEEYIEMNDTRVKYTEKFTAEVTDYCIRSGEGVFAFTGMRELRKKRIACLSSDDVDSDRCSDSDDLCSTSAKIHINGTSDDEDDDEEEERSSLFDWIPLIVFLLLVLLAVLLMIAVHKVRHPEAPPDVMGEAEGRYVPELAPSEPGQEPEAGHEKNSKGGSFRTSHSSKRSAHSSKRADADRDIE